MLFADVMHALNRSHRGHVVSTVLRVFVMFIALSTSLTLGVARVEAQDSPGSSAPTIDSILTRMARIQGLELAHHERGHDRLRKARSDDPPRHAAKPSDRLHRRR
jgi:hypothetical protein